MAGRGRLSSLSGYGRPLGRGLTKTQLEARLTGTEDAGASLGSQRDMAYMDDVYGSCLQYYSLYEVDVICTVTSNYVH
jgi:hypothetical protein